MRFAEYQAGPKLRGTDGFGPLTARSHDDYLAKDAFVTRVAKVSGCKP
ncbi:hypothetical protein ACGF3G_09950 [Streptomyces sp. NPDC048179]